MNNNYTKQNFSLRLRGDSSTGGAEALLGNNTDFTAKKEKVFDNQLLTMEIDGQNRLIRKDFNGELHVVDIDGKRALMFERQNAARLILGSDSRLKFCLRWNASGVKDGLSIAIQKSETNARYKNLSVCGLGWVCPVCANKISEYRRQEMLIAQDKHDQTDGKRYLITWTFPHTRFDKLDDIYLKLRKAREWMTSHRTYKNYSTQCVGSIRTVEITLGENGWHPHVHEIWFANSSFDLSSMKQTLFKIWSQACSKVGLPLPSFEHGIDIKESKFASDYVAKWGFEMTRWHQKNARSGGMTPFQLLDAYIDEDDQVKSNYYKTKFLEFFKSTKGTSQLRWSKGLRSHFLIDEVDDSLISQDLVNTVSDYKHFMFLTSEEWKFIRDYRKGFKRVKIDLRADVLSMVCKVNTEKEVKKYLKDLGFSIDKT